MNRQIEFRGLTKEGKWVKGVPVESVNGITYMVIRATNGEDFMFVEVIPETVGQWTGLEDAEEQRIYEGDKVVLYERFSNGKLFKENEGVVVFSNLGTFSVSIKERYIRIPLHNYIGSQLSAAHDTSCIKVIGTIHDKEQK